MLSKGEETGEEQSFPHRSAYVAKTKQIKEKQAI